MIYMDGDNDLEQNCIDDMVELENVGWAEDVTVVILMDTLTFFDGLHWLVISETPHDLDPVSGVCSCDCDDLVGGCVDELNMGDGQTLKYFLEEAVTIAPASNYMLVLWDHGASWFGVCEDWSSPLPDGSHDVLTMQEIETAVTSADMCGAEIDIIAFDACLMGAVEVAYELRNCASYIVGAVTTVPRLGLPYDALIGAMQNSLDRSPERVGMMAVDTYIELLDQCAGNGVGGYPYAAMSLIDLSTISDFVLGVESYPGGIDDLGAFLIGACTEKNSKGSIEPLESKTPQIQYLGEQDPFIDIGLFAESLRELMPESAAVVDGTLELLSETVVYQRFVTNEYGACLSTYGISIYFTVSENWLLDCYAYELQPTPDEQHWGLDLPADTCWDEFLFALSNAA